MNKVLGYVVGIIGLAGFAFALFSRGLSERLLRIIKQEKRQASKEAEEQLAEAITSGLDKIKESERVDVKTSDDGLIAIANRGTE